MTETPSPVAGRELEELARSMRGAIGSLRAAAETLEKFPALDGVPRARLLAVVSQESERLGELAIRVERIAHRAVADPAEGAPPTIAVDELMARLTAAAGELGYEVESRRGLDPIAPPTRLDVPGPQVIGAATAFLALLRREMAVARLQLGAQRVDRHLLLDFGWSPDPAEVTRLLDWQGEALDAPPEDAAGRPLAPEGLRPMARAHDGEAWFNLDRDGSAAHVKLLLPIAVEEPGATR